MELVDTQDLKSCGHCARAGSSPAPGTLIISKTSIVSQTLFYSVLHHVTVRWIGFGLGIDANLGVCRSNPFIRLSSFLFTHSVSETVAYVL